MAFSRGSDLAAELIAALGLEGRPIVGLALKVRVQEMATVEVEELVQEASQAPLAQALETRTFKLVEEEPCPPKKSRGVKRRRSGG